MSTQYLDKTGLTYFWEKIKDRFLNGNAGGVFYGTCSTAAGTTAKVVDCTAFTSADLVAGAIISVRFSATNSGAVASLTLNVNSTGAKNIKYINNGTLGNLSSAGYLKANTTYFFVYDGTYWVVMFNYNTTYSAMSEAEALAGTATTARTITAARLKQAIEEHAPITSVSVTQKTSSGVNIADITVDGVTTELYAPAGGGGGAVTSVNGQTGDVTIAVPTKTSDLTNDSGFITSAPVTSVNGQTGAVTLTIPSTTSQLTNDSDFLVAGLIDDYLTPKVYAADTTSQTIIAAMFGGTPIIRVPNSYPSLLALLYDLNPRVMIAWMNGTELELSRMGVSANTSNNEVTLYLRGRTSTATGIFGVDSSWTVTPYPSAVEIERW